MNEQIYTLAQHLGERLNFRKWSLVTAESCTGGGVGQALTSVPGSSQWFDGGIIAYSNAMKQQLLNVDAALIANHGAVSEQIAMAMLEGVLRVTSASLAVSVTGIAGPSGGSEDKPVGTVCIAYGSAHVRYAQTFHFDGDRQSIREQSINTCIKLILRFIDNEKNTV